MFHLTLTPNISKIFEGFCILKKRETIICPYTFPSNYSFQRFYEFIFPCNCPKEKSEEYCIVTSNASNDRSFLLCRYCREYDLYLCIYSHNPWFEIFSKILFNLSHNEFMPHKYHLIGAYLQKVSEGSSGGYVVLPPCNANDKTPQKILKCSMKYPHMYDKYIQEYLTAVKPSSHKQLWLEIFWSMLLERPIIFMSKRYQKLTSSLLVATFFLHPLSWLHKFVSIIPRKNPQLLGMNCCMLGIHNCMEPILEKVEFWNEALLVDLDKGDSYMIGKSENKQETKSRFRIPNYITSFFISHMQMADKSVTNKSRYQHQDIIPSSPLTSNEEEVTYNEYKKGFHVYPLLFRTIIAALIGNYRQFIYSVQNGYEFDKERFIQSNSKLSQFLRIFVQSQCFDCFIEEKLKFIGTGQDTNDRFDRERQELMYKSKVLFPKVKQKMKYNKKEKNTNTKSLSSSSSSINGNSNLSQENIDDYVHMKYGNDSLMDQIRKGLVERNIINDLFDPCFSTNNLSRDMKNEKKAFIPQSCDKNMKLASKIGDVNPLNAINDAKPCRPLHQPGEITSGKVQNLIHQINYGNLDGTYINNIKKKIISPIKASELPPNTKPVSELASMFEHKPRV